MLFTRFLVLSLFSFAACFLLFSPLIASSSLSDSDSAASSHRHILFRSGSINTLERAEPVFQPSSSSSDSSVSSVRQHYLIHYAPPLTQEIRSAIEAAIGVPLNNYYPHNTYLVYVTPESAQSARSIPGVLWVGDYDPEHKVADPVADGQGQIVVDSMPQPEVIVDNFHPMSAGSADSSDEDFSSDSQFDLNVQIGAGHSREEVQRFGEEYINLIKSQLQIDASFDVRSTTKVHITIPRSFKSSLFSAVSDLLAKRPEVHSIVRRPVYEIQNAWSRGTTLADINILKYDAQGRVPGLFTWEHGLTGLGEIVGVTDTGVDVNSCFFYDANFPNFPNFKEYQEPPEGSIFPPNFYSQPQDHAHRKIVQYVAFGDTQDDNGHGSHCAGTVAGKAPNSAPAGGPANFDGIAPFAKLTVFDMGVGKDGKFPRLPDPLNINLFPWAYAAGAKVHSNSWGTRTNAYTAECYEVDEFVWRQKDFLILFAAGNDGKRGPGSIGAPATAKNLLTVGATMSSNPAWTVGFGGREGSVQNSPKMVDFAQRNPKLFNEDSMACFSSQGPTYDNRIKPEVVAPGFFLMSARAGQNPSTSCSNPLNRLVHGLAGTSQATPTLAGVAALIRQYFRDGFYPPITETPVRENAFSPSAALVKGIIIASAVEINGQFDKNCAIMTPNVQPAPVPLNSPVPSPLQGFGRVQLNTALSFFGDEHQLIIPRPTTSVDEFGDPVLTPGGDAFQFPVCMLGPVTSGASAKITLVWTDYPAQPNSAKALVNNLDLIVTNTATGQVFYGNGRLTDNRRADDLHNVEVVMFTPAMHAAGTTYTISVAPTSIHTDQPFSLVITGKFKSGACSDASIMEAMSADSMDPAAALITPPSMDRPAPPAPVVEDKPLMAPVITDVQANTELVGDALTWVVSVAFSSHSDMFTVRAEPGNYVLRADHSPIAFSGLPAGVYTFTVEDKNGMVSAPHANFALAASQPSRSPLVNNGAALKVESLTYSLQEVNGESHTFISVEFSRPAEREVVEGTRYILTAIPVSHLTARLAGSEKQGDRKLFSTEGYASPLTIVGLRPDLYMFTVTEVLPGAITGLISPMSTAIRVLETHGELYSWSPSTWSSCSTICGQRGVQTRSVVCKSSKGAVVSDEYCRLFVQAGNKPIAIQECNRVDCGALSFSYFTSQWSACDKLCGGGVQRRVVDCRSSTNASVPETFCADRMRPLDVDQCNTQPCRMTQDGKEADTNGALFNARWEVSNCTSPCSQKCGGGVCPRSVRCMLGSMEVGEEFCMPPAGLPKPSEEMYCNLQQCPDGADPTPNFPPVTFRWLIGSWSACSVGCGGGVQTRPVRCWNSAGFVDSDQFCLGDPTNPIKSKPVTTHQCNMDACPMPHPHPAALWLKSDWSRCKPSRNESYRWVSCVDTNGQILPASECEARAGPKPDEVRNCRVSVDEMDPERLVGQSELESLEIELGQAGLDSSFDASSRRLVPRESMFWAVTRWSHPTHLCSIPSVDTEKASLTDTSIRAPSIETRLLYCMGAEGYVAERRSECLDSIVEIEEPQSKREPRQLPCPASYGWVPGPWSECTEPKPCEGVETRRVLCVDSAGRVQNDRSWCSAQQPPVAMRTCGACKTRPQQDIAVVPLLRQTEPGEKEDLPGAVYVHRPLATAAVPLEVKLPSHFMEAPLVVSPSNSASGLAVSHLTVAFSLLLALLALLL